MTILTQGNNRVVVDEEGTVEEVNHYYPFGGVFSSTGDAQPYKYNGKELDRKGGLDFTQSAQPHQLVHQTCCQECAHERPA